MRALHAPPLAQVIYARDSASRKTSASITAYLLHRADVPEPQGRLAVRASLLEVNLEVWRRLRAFGSRQIAS